MKTKEIILIKIQNNPQYLSTNLSPVTEEIITEKKVSEPDTAKDKNSAKNKDECFLTFFTLTKYI